ncbi:uncharacterized protein C8Q71DRAFT_754228 [Rhodofomes roseus]|uniref:Uncharacterized protein n=1 Tax=Rhodofomes roseus TaxID=34475 RepID=A0ABQ8KIF2_9APHY|nr:uncharacterized protein C8Q71DRAFT_754228 [Rhodofomes roseus]KAH9837739.1 hypothetical protein C8Q71DRAFT_754228 [Rhodofomes roseus]
MAALFLHQALFSSESSVVPQTASSARSSFTRDRRLSAVSSVTLHTVSNSDHSHPTEPLLNPPIPEASSSSTYVDLLARQPRHPTSPSSAADGALSLEGDPLTANERRSHWERRTRRRLRRLRWTKRSLLSVIGAWATYNTIRYFLAFAIYPYHDRQLILLSLGTCTAFSLTFILISVLIGAFAPYLGWTSRPNAPHAVVQVILTYMSSALLLSPAVVNLAFVFVWRHTPNLINTLVHRCRWDIDVFWSGLGSQCNVSPSWAEWLAGSVVRLVLTLAVLIAYHLTAYHYDITLQPSRRRRRSRPRSGSSVPSVTPKSTSTGTHHPMSSTSTPVSPLSLSQIGRQLSISTSEGHATIESYSSSGEHRPLRSSQSRINAQSFLASRSKDGFASPALSPTRSEKDRSLGVSAFSKREDTSPNSSDEDLPSSLGTDRFGRSIRRIPGNYTLPGAPDASHTDNPGEPPRDAMSDNELYSFVDRFRSLVDQIARETEEGITLAQNESPGYASSMSHDIEDLRPSYRSTFPSDDDDDYVPVLGKTIHRMPTIESLGSREVMSLATSSLHRASPGPHHMSRPSTRSNTFSLSEAGMDTPSVRSRANSLDAALALVSTPTTTDLPDEVWGGSVQPTAGSGDVSRSGSHASSSSKSNPQEPYPPEGE